MVTRRAMLAVAFAAALLSMTIASAADFPVKWSRVVCPAGLACEYELGYSSDGEIWTKAKRIAWNWDTGTIVAPTPGPWYLGIRVCVVGDSGPCGEWRKARNCSSCDPSDTGPFYPTGLILPPVPEAWRTDVADGQGG